MLTSTDCLPSGKQFIQALGLTHRNYEMGVALGLLQRVPATPQTLLWHHSIRIPEGLHTALMKSEIGLVSDPRIQSFSRGYLNTKPTGNSTERCTETM